MPYYIEREQRRRARESQIAEMVRTGHSHVEIGRELGISGPAVTHYIRNSPELRELRRRHSTTHRERLRALRQDVLTLVDELKTMQREARKTIRDLDEELESAAIDEALGLR